MGSVTVPFAAPTGLTGLTATAVANGMSVTGTTPVESPAGSGVYPSTFATLPNTRYVAKLKNGSQVPCTANFLTDADGYDASRPDATLPITPTVTPSGGSFVVGKIAAQAISDTSVTLAVAVTGGTGPYAYQWHRSLTAGFTPGAGTAISGATSATLTDSPLPGQYWYYKCKASDSAAHTATTTDRVVRLGTYPTPLALPTRTPPGGKWRVLYCGDSTGIPAQVAAGLQAPVEIACDLINQRTPLAVTYGNYAVPGETAASWTLNYLGGMLLAEGATQDEETGDYTMPAGNYVAVVRFGSNEARYNLADAAGYKASLQNLISILTTAGIPVVLSYPTGYEIGSWGGELPVATLVQYQAQIDSLIDGNTVHAGDRTSFRETSLAPQALLHDELHQNIAGSRRMGLADAVGIVQAITRVYDAKLGSFADRNPLALATSTQATTAQSSLTTLTGRLTLTRAQALDNVAPIKAKTDLIGTSNADSPRMIQAATDAGSAATNAMTAAGLASTLVSSISSLASSLYARLGFSGSGSDNAKDAIGGVADQVGEGGGVMVVPLTLAAVAEAYAANGVHPLKLSCVQGEAASWLFTITDSLAQPVNLTGKSLRFVVRDGNDANRFKAEPGDGITLVDAAAGSVRVTLAPDQTDLRGSDGQDYAGQWVLWDLTTNKALGRGAFRIAAAVKDVEDA